VALLLTAATGCAVNEKEVATASHEEVPAAQSLAVTAVPAQRPSAAAPAPGDANDDETDQQAWQSIRAALEKPGELRDGVLSFLFPRDDLEVTIQGNDTPVAAGIASDFRFYRCPCGLLNVLGQFVVADYEANDVIDALREGRVEVASVGPMLLHERPRLLLVRFQGENKHGGHLAKTLRTALSWTGKERMAPQKLDH
jgi:hypothetical protein